MTTTKRKMTRRINKTAPAKVERVLDSEIDEIQEAYKRVAFLTASVERNEHYKALLASPEFQALNQAKTILQYINSRITGKYKLSAPDRLLRPDGTIGPAEKESNEQA